MPMDLAMLTDLGLPEILLWLLTFAVVYGVLAQVRIPENREARAIISIVVGLFVLFAVPSNLIEIISSMSSSLILVVLGILVLLVFLEVAGLKHYEAVKDEKGNVVGTKPVSLFSANKYITAIAFIIIAILIFAGAGGLGLLGLDIPDFTEMGSLTMLFFVVIIIDIFIYSS